MRRGVYQDLVALVVEPHRRETDPIVRTDQTQSHRDRLIEQPFVLWIEITQARCLLAFADRKLALLQAVSDTTKIGYREAFRHCLPLDSHLWRARSIWKIKTAHKTISRYYRLY